MWGVLACCALPAAPPCRAQLNQLTSRWVLNDRGAWEDPKNWLRSDGRAAFPSAAFDDHGRVANGGVAVVTSSREVANLEVSPGGVEVLAGGLLQVRHDLVATEGGVLSIGPRGVFQVAEGGAAEIQLDIDNSGVLAIGVAGSSIHIARDLSSTGTLAVEVGGPGPGSISVDGAARIGGELRITTHEGAPSIGDSWTILRAAEIVGAFDAVDASLAYEAPRGMGFAAASSGGTLTVSAVNTLVLNVDRQSGAMSIENAGPDDLAWNGYAIRSNAGNLHPEPWRSLASAGDGVWAASPATPKLLAEVSFSGERSLAPGASLDLGAAYAGGPIFARNEDVEFSYTTPTGEIRTGLVDYHGVINDVTLAIDPTTGVAEIRNLSPERSAAQAIYAYSISSYAGSLDPQGWIGWEESSAPGLGWNSTSKAGARKIAESNASSSTYLSEGRTLRLGTVFTPGAVRDVRFEYSVRDVSKIPGDATGEGAVDLEDFNVVKENFGLSDADRSDGDFNGDHAVDLQDFNVIKEHFGEVGAPGEAGVFPGAVVYETLASATPIKLIVDQNSGEMEIRNSDGEPAAEIFSYSIASASGELSPSRWIGLEESRLGGPGWSSIAPVGAKSLGEVAELAPIRLEAGDRFSLGLPFAVGGRRDLVFHYTVAGASETPGDANGDGATDLEDMNILKKNFGAVGVDRSQGDFTGDGVVDLNDFVVLNENFGAVGETSEPIEVIGSVIYERREPLSPLELVIDPNTGAAAIRNNAEEGEELFSITSYTITSKTGSLNPPDWIPLADGDLGDAGWTVVGDASPERIAEQGGEALSLVGGELASLGAPFAFQGVYDLMFEFTVQGTSSVPGDANGDGVADLADFNLLKAKFGQTASSPAEGDLNGDGVVNLSDFNVLKDGFGGSGAPGEQTTFVAPVRYESLADVEFIPEPPAYFLAGAALLFAAMQRRRR